MLNNIRKRFITFNMLTISVIATLLALLVFFGSRSTLSWQRLLMSIVIILILVFLGSLLLSRLALGPIKQAWQKQLDFTADASHELRTPLSVIKTNLELVMDSPKESVESQMRWLYNIKAENDRMAKLVEDLLTLSRADTSQQVLDKKTFMLNEVLEAALIPVQPVAKSKQIELTFIPGLQIAMYGDCNRIKQLIIILVDNAIKYTSSHGKVSVKLRRNKKMAELVVSDTGCGIEEEYLEKIFDRFYRGVKSRQLNQDGTGIGLAIAKWIVTEHQGRISVDSQPGHGTIFTVLLPVE